jgi:hypothetical protein
MGHGTVPAVLLKKCGNRMRAVMGWRLTSLMSAQLAANQLGGADLREGTSELLLKRFFWNRESLLRVVARWPQSASLELDFRFEPNLGTRSSGKAAFHVFLWVFESSPTAAKETIHTLCFQLQALLGATFVEADFTPILDAKVLSESLDFFTPAQTIALERKRVCALEEPKRKALGFVAAHQTAKAERPITPPLVELTTKWRGNPYALDQLVEYCAGLPYVSWYKVRVASAGGLDAERKELAAELERYSALEQSAMHGTSQWAKTLADIALKRLVELERERLQVGVYALFCNGVDSSFLAFLESAMAGDPAEQDMASQSAISEHAVKPKDALRGDYFSDQRSCSIMEAAQAFRLPLPPVATLSGVEIKSFRSQYAPDHLLPRGEGRTFLGHNEHRGVAQDVGISLEDRFRHLYCIGMTGVGKSTFLEHLLLSDMEAGHGVCLVDPHGELIQGLLGKIPAHREKDVILIDPTDTEYPVGINLLEWCDIQERDFIIDSLFSALDAMYDLRQTGGPIFEMHYRNMLKLLMGDKKHEHTFTVLEFAQIYNDKAFRDFLKDLTSEYDVVQFLNEAILAGGDADFRNVRPYVTSKFSRFNTDSLLRNIFGQSKTTFSFEDVVDNGKILLINLAKGQLGHNVGGLLASQIISRIKVAAMRRAKMPETQRRPFFLYVDEFQNVDGGEFSEMLAEARKYKLGLVMANQYVRQLQPKRENNADLIQAILGNVGTFVLFQVGPEDARQLEPLVLPQLSRHDLMSLPERKAYVRVRSGAARNWPFVMSTVKHPVPGSESVRTRIVERSRILYGCDRREVESKIQERRETKWGEVTRQRPCMDYEKAL